MWFGAALLRMLRAVEHLRANGLVHGDIKDDQFFVDDSGRQGSPGRGSKGFFDPLGILSPPSMRC